MPDVLFDAADLYDTERIDALGDNDRAVIDLWHTGNTGHTDPSCQDAKYHPNTSASREAVADLYDRMPLCIHCAQRNPVIVGLWSLTGDLVTDSDLRSYLHGPLPRWTRVVSPAARKVNADLAATATTRAALGRLRNHATPIDLWPEDGRPHGAHRARVALAAWARHLQPHIGPLDERIARAACELPVAPTGTTRDVAVFLACIGNLSAHATITDGEHISRTVAACGVRLDRYDLHRRDHADGPGTWISGWLDARLAYDTQQALVHGPDPAVFAAQTATGDPAVIADTLTALLRDSATNGESLDQHHAQQLLSAAVTLTNLP